MNKVKTSNGKQGGVLEGPSHANGGIKAVVVDDNRPIEVEGGEVIINKHAAKKHWRELSKINQSAGNGVAIHEPQFRNGGEVEKGVKVEREHIKTLEKTFKHKITPKQALKEIAKEHVKENPHYYSNLKKLEKDEKGNTLTAKQQKKFGKVMHEFKEGDLRSGSKHGNKVTDRKQAIAIAYSEARNVHEEGGNLKAKNKEVYKKWKQLVNMSYAELEKFYNSEEGHEAGLSKSEADNLGISNGRESAKWILKMKKTKVDDWTLTMWRWANKQISFISRMSGVKGDLYDDKGNKTRKHLALLIWGHNPNKKENGGEVIDNVFLENGGKVTTYKNKYNKKFGYDKNESHNLSEISKDTGVSKKGLQQIYNKGVGAYNTNPRSVRKNVHSEEQWAMGRVYSAVMGGKASKVDAHELKMNNGGVVEKYKDYEIEIKNDYEYIVTAIKEGKRVGLLTFLRNPYNSKNGEKYLLVDRIDVFEKERNKGLATEMYLLALKHLPEEYKGIASDLKNRVNESEIPKIYSKFKNRVEDWGGVSKYHLIDADELKMSNGGDVVSSITNRILNGDINSDDGAIELFDKGIEVDEVLYDKLRDAENIFKTKSKGIQVGDTIIVKGKHDNNDFKANFRGYNTDGRLVIVYEGGKQMMIDKDDYYLENSYAGGGDLESVKLYTIKDFDNDTIQENLTEQEVIDFVNVTFHYHYIDEGFEEVNTLDEAEKLLNTIDYKIWD